MQRRSHMWTWSRNLWILWTKAHLKLTEAKWETVPWSDESKYEILFGNHGHSILRSEKERDLPASTQFKSHTGSQGNTWSDQDDIFSREGLAYFSKTALNHRNHRLHSKRVWVLDWPACSTDLSPTENIWYKMKRKTWQRRNPRLLRSSNPKSDKNGTTFLAQRSGNWSPSLLTGAQWN